MGLFLRAAAGCAGDLVLAAPAGATDPSGRTHVPGKIFDGYWSVVVSGVAWAAQHWRESLQVNSSSRPALRPYNGFTACTHAYINLALSPRICGAFATLVRNHPNWIVLLGGEKSFWLICARALAAADSIVHED